jgi:putative membrane protein
LPVSWGIGLVLRPLVMDVTYLFDRRLGSTELMEAETDDTAPNRPKLKMLLTALFNDEAEKQVLTEKAARFEKRYPTLVRVGLWSMLLIPSVFLILLFSVETKLVFLVLWVIFLIALAIYLIVVEYIHDKLQMQRTLDNTTSSDLMTQLKENVQ